MTDKEILNKFPIGSYVKKLGFGCLNPSATFKVTGYTINIYNETILLIRDTQINKSFKVHPKNVYNVNYRGV